MFEQAFKNKYRFKSSRGDISVEDLFDLPLTSARSVSLEQVAQALDDEIGITPKRNFGSKATPANSELQAKLDIVLYIVAIRRSEKDEATVAKVKAAKKEVLLAALHAKRTEAIGEMSEEDILAALAE